MLLFGAANQHRCAACLFWVASRHTQLSATSSTTVGQTLSGWVLHPPQGPLSHMLQSYLRLGGTDIPDQEAHYCGKVESVVATPQRPGRVVRAGQFSIFLSAGNRMRRKFVLRAVKPPSAQLLTAVRPRSPNLGAIFVADPSNIGCLAHALTIGSSRR